VCFVITFIYLFMYLFIYRLSFRLNLENWCIHCSLKEFFGRQNGRYIAIRVIYMIYSLWNRNKTLSTLVKCWTSCYCDWSVRWLYGKSQLCVQCDTWCSFGVVVDQTFNCSMWIEDISEWLLWGTKRLTTIKPYLTDCLMKCHDFGDVLKIGKCLFLTVKDFLNTT
jgi:hypothetical protein